MAANLEIELRLRVIVGLKMCSNAFVRTTNMAANLKKRFHLFFSNSSTDWVEISSNTRPSCGVKWYIRTSNVAVIGTNFKLRLDV